MGYRSEVAFVIKKEAVMKMLLKGHKFPSIFNEAEHDEFGEDADGYTFDSIKWYSNYAHIQEAETYLDAIDDTESFGFVRVGGEYDDVEMQGSPYLFQFGPQTTIEFW